jgi:hypothetical protein
VAIARGRAANRRIARQWILLKWGSVPAPVFAPLFLLALLVLVHCPGLVVSALSQTNPPKPGVAAKKEAPPPPTIHYGTEQLPGPVRELREAMLSAVQSGEIEELRHVYELNDIKPDLGTASSGDPVANWKRVSGDGKGQEVLAALSLILEAGYVVLPLGRDLENNRLYIWPYFAEVPLDKLTPAQEVELLRLVPPAVAKSMREKGRYTHWSLAIGADGSWHSFKKAE